jgi:hypothetical protein
MGCDTPFASKREPAAANFCQRAEAQLSAVLNAASPPVFGVMKPNLSSRPVVGAALTVVVLCAAPVVVVAPAVVGVVAAVVVVLPPQAATRPPRPAPKPTVAPAIPASLRKSRRLTALCPPGPDSSCRSDVFGSFSDTMPPSSQLRWTCRANRFLFGLQLYPLLDSQS